MMDRYLSGPGSGSMIVGLYPVTDPWALGEEPDPKPINCRLKIWIYGL
jgi:hypothetical protein